jgi:predicted oxidoreductase
MEYIRINEQVTFSRIIQGMWRIASWHFDVDQLIAFMEGCIRLGVTTFDTAEIYGNYEGEAMIGEALKKKPELRGQIQIVTKTGINMASSKRPYTIGHYDTRYDKIVSSCLSSIEKLHCGYIDVYLIHREDPLIDHHEVARALNYLQEKGYIKAYGVSNFDPFKMDALMYATGNKLVTNQIELNPVCFEHFQSGMIDYLGKYSIPPMIWSPLAGGRLFTSDEEKYKKVRNKLEEIAKRHNENAETIAYAWLLYHPVKMMPISGSSRLDRLEMAVHALDVRLTHEEWYEIYLASGENILR